MKDEPLMVGSKTNPSSLAGAIAEIVRDQHYVELQMIGAGAINQATKAWAIARGYLAPSGIDLVGFPAFVDLQIDGEDRTAIRFTLFRKNVG